MILCTLRVPALLLPSALPCCCPPCACPALARAGSDAGLLAEQLPAPCDQLISFLCYYCVVMVNLPTPPIREGRMGEAVIRGNLIRSCFISSGSPTPWSTIGVHCLRTVPGTAPVRMGHSATAPWLRFLSCCHQNTQGIQTPPGFAGQQLQVA